MTGARRDLVEALAERIHRTVREHPLRVAVDGPDAAGKTTLADELVAPLAARGGGVGTAGGSGRVVRASLDGFHRPRAERYRRGADSPVGCYHDSFDLDAVLAHVLRPLGPGGSRRVRTAVFDHRSDRAALAAPRPVPDDAVLLFDGVFLLRPELAPEWDFAILLVVPEETSLRRAVERDRALLGSAAAVEARYRRRYLPAQRLYTEAVRPRERADAVVDNTDPDRPRLLA